VHIIGYNNANETNLSTESSKTEKDAWISQTDEEQIGQEGAQAQAKKGAEEARRIIDPSRTDTRNSRKTLKRAEILRPNSEIRWLFKHGRRRKFGNITFIYFASETRKTGFIASRKIGGAVKRNKAKRILREAFRMKKEYFSGMKVILYAETDVTFTQVADAIDRFRSAR